MHKVFWENGYKIFGLHDFDGDMCGCGNVKCPTKSIGKHPRIKSWQNVPLWSEEQLEAFGKCGTFDSGYGVLCEGLIVVDVDARNGGIASYAKLCEVVPEIMGAGLVVNTGSGGGSQHLYFKNPSCKALRSHYEDFPGIDFKSSGFVVGAGSNHKSGKKYEVAVGEVFDIDDAPKGLLDLLEVKAMHRTTVSGQVYDFTDGDIESMLSVIDCDCDYEKWLQIGMAIHHATDGAGLVSWDAWSKAGSKYAGFNELETKWHGFGKTSDSITIGTIIHYAEQSGWVRSVEFETYEFADVHIETSHNDMFNTDDIDARRPPDFVGEVCQWINSSCNYKRENLAVSAALTAVSNAAGMRFYDRQTNMHANLYSVCVAGSGTGKNSILKAIKKLATAAGIAPALAGGIKSEQEIYRNLLRNQAVLYTIDEIGEILGKLVKAKARGSASYLDAVIAVLLTAYSSAGDSLLVSGDLKQEIQDEIRKELKAQQKALDNNESKNTIKTQERIEHLERQLVATDCGIEDPFVSIFGLTTPDSFDSIMDFEMSTNGFVARTLIFRESDNNPKFHDVATEMRDVPPHIESEMLRLYTGGHYASDEIRVERKGKKQSIETTKEARIMLNKIRDDYFWYMSEKHDEKTGLASIPRRGAEMVEKVSLILGIASGLRTLEHVRYAFALVKIDIDLKLKVAHSNDDKKSSGLFARILSILSNDKGMSIGVVSNRCRKYDIKDIEKSLVLLEEQGEVKAIDETSKDGKKTMRFYLS